jgi:hypothetical protein
VSTLTVVGLDLARHRPKPVAPVDAQTSQAAGRKRLSPVMLAAIVVPLILLPAAVGGYFLLPKGEKGRQASDKGSEEVVVPDASGRYRALLVAVEEYKDSKDLLRPLRFPAQDVEEMAEVLEKLGYEVTLVTEKQGKANPDRIPSAANIIRHVDAAAAACGKGHTLVVAFAGHGLHLKTDNVEQSYYCPCDAGVTKATENERVKEFDRSRLVPVNRVIETLNTKGAGQKFLIIDACRDEPDGFRGSPPPPGVDSAGSMHPAEGVSILLSCSPGERSQETPNLGKGHGVFFYFIIDGFRGAAKDSEGTVTGPTLANHVNKQVSNYVRTRIGHGAKQTPQMRTFISGQPTVLAKWEPSLFEPLITVSGKVMRAGAPLPSTETAKVRVTLFKPMAAQSYTGEVKDDGSFEIQGLPRGGYRVAVEQIDTGSKADRLGGKFSRQNTRVFREFRANTPVEIDLDKPDA